MFILNVIKNILINKNIVLLSSQLQVINFYEFLFLKTNLSIKLKDSVIIIIADNEEDKRYEKINFLIKKYSLKNITINANKNILIKFCYILTKIRKKLFKNIEFLVIGNLFSKINKEFINISNKVIILDDGVNIFWKENKIRHNKKYLFFSLFKKHLFNNNKYMKNNLLHLKKKMDRNLKYSKKYFMIGPPHIYTKNVDKNQYAILVKKVITKFKNEKIYSLPHPKENIDLIKKFKNLVFVKTNLPVEHYFIKEIKIPKLIISFSSSSLMSLNYISNKFRFFNMRPKFKKIFFNSKFENWQSNYIKELSKKNIHSYRIKV